MQIEQRFNGTGWTGIIALFLGPLLAGYGYWDLMATVTRNVALGGYLSSSTTPALVMMVIGGIASLAAFPMMIIGRDFECFPSSIDGSGNIDRHKEPALFEVAQ